MSHGTVLGVWEKEGGCAQANVTSTLDAALHEQPALSGFLRLGDGTFAHARWRESPQCHDDPFYWGFPSYLAERVVELGVENFQQWNHHELPGDSRKTIARKEIWCCCFSRPCPPAKSSASPLCLTICPCGGYVMDWR